MWSLETGTLLHSLRGHTGSVTSVRLLPRFKLNSKADVDGEENAIEWGPAAVSGSYDCSLKVWDLTSGSLISSTYTYNPITRLVLLPVSQYERIGAITGTDGGKLELFQLNDQPISLLSERVHEEGITGLASKKISNHHGGEMVVVASGARDGLVKVHRVEEDGKRLSCLYVSEEVRSNPGVSVNPRPVSCIQISGEWMFKLIFPCYSTKLFTIFKPCCVKYLESLFLIHEGIKFLAALEALSVCSETLIRTTENPGPLNRHVLPSWWWRF